MTITIYLPKDAKVEIIQTNSPEEDPYMMVEDGTGEMVLRSELVLVKTHPDAPAMWLRKQ